MVKYVPECRDINKLHPKLQELAEQLIFECQKASFNIRIGETFRNIERQDYLYAQGRTRPGKIITNAKGSSMSSYHQWGLAFDIFHNVKGDEYNITVLKKAGEIGRKLGLEWGGDWKRFKDYPHFQYTFGLRISDLRAGKKPPEHTLDRKGYICVKKKVIIEIQSKEVDFIELEGLFFENRNYIAIKDIEQFTDLKVGYNKKTKNPIIVKSTN